VGRLAAWIKSAENSENLAQNTRSIRERRAVRARDKEEDRETRHSNRNGRRRGQKSVQFGAKGRSGEELSSDS